MLEQIQATIDETKDFLEKTSNPKLRSALESELAEALEQKQELIKLIKQAKETNKIQDKIKIYKEQLKIAIANNNLSEHQKIKSEISKLRKKLYKPDNIKYLTKKELDNFFKAFDKLEAKNSQRDWLMAKLGYEAGLRISEVIDLKVEDYNIRDKKLFCNRKKGSKKNYLHLTDETGEALKRYIFNNNRDEYIFSSRQNKVKITNPDTINKSLKKYFKLAKIKPDKQHFHVFKHSLAVHLLEIGASLKQVQEALGHNSIRSTEVYAAFSKKQQYDLRKIMGR